MNLCPVLKQKPYVWKPTEKPHFDRLRDLNNMVMEVIVSLLQDEDIVKRTSVNESLVIKKFNKMFPRSKVLKRTLKKRLRELRKLGYIDFKVNPHIRDEERRGYYYAIKLKLSDSQIKRQKSNLFYYGVVSDE